MNYHKNNSGRPVFFVVVMTFWTFLVISFRGHFGRIQKYGKKIAKNEIYVLEHFQMFQKFISGFFKCFRSYSPYLNIMEASWSSHIRVFLPEKLFWRKIHLGCILLCIWVFRYIPLFCQLYTDLGKSGNFHNISIWGIPQKTSEVSWFKFRKHSNSSYCLFSNFCAFFQFPPNSSPKSLKEID